MIKKVFVGLVVILVLFAGLNATGSVQAATQTKYVTASTLNVRSGPGTNYKVVTTVKKNQAVQVTQSKGKWNKVTVGKKTGWVSGAYLATKKPTTATKKSTKATTSAKTSTTMYVTASSLNVRSGASTSHKVVTTVKKNKAVKVTQNKGTWSKVTVGSKTGWVSNKYLTTKKPAAKAATPKKTVNATTSKTMYVTASALNVRSGAGTNYKVVSTVKKNQAVQVTQTKGKWNKITVGKKTGWVSGAYLTTKKPAAPKATTLAKNLAEGLKTVGNNQQLILVTSNGYNTNVADIKTFEKNAKGKWVQVLSVKGHVGKHGYTNNKSEGDTRTPIGKYTIGTAFGQKGNPGTKIPFRNITSDDVWVDDPASKLYNTWQSKKKTQGQWKSAENMNHRLYTYGFVINYNTKQVPNKGSAIFFHVGSSYTLGCVATSEANVKSIMKWLDPKKNPVIIMTPTQELDKY